MVCWGSQSHRLLDICHKYLPVYNGHSLFKTHHCMVIALSGKQMEGWGNSSNNNLALLHLDKAIKYLQADICFFFFFKQGLSLAPIISISSSCHGVFASVGYFSVFLFFLFLFHPPLFPSVLLSVASWLWLSSKNLHKIYNSFQISFHRPPASCWGNSWFSLYSERVGPQIHRCQASGSFPSPYWKPKFLITQNSPAAICLVTGDQGGVFCRMVHSGTHSGGSN